METCKSQHLDSGSPSPIWFFKKEVMTEKGTETDLTVSGIIEHGKSVRCAYCHALITYQGNAESVSGNHVHCFVNPGGYEFTIACYRKAWCKNMGLPTLEWSWFNGYSWQYALCPQCQEHLGWFYQNSATQHSFYGLILDRLIIEESNHHHE